MRRHLLILLAILFSMSLHASSQIKVEDVGYGGRLNQRGEPTPILVTVSNDQPMPLQGDVLIATTWGANEAKHTDTYSFPVSLAAGEKRDLELPVLLRGWNVKDVSAQLRGAGGNVIAVSDFAGSLYPGGDALVLILCEGNACVETQKTIQFSGSVEENESKNNRFKLLTSGKPRENWWSYTVLEQVVLAMPPSRLSPTQMSALEGYVRSGGTVVLLENLLSGSDWLTPYRADGQSRGGVKVGRGKVMMVPSETSVELGRIFNAAVALQRAPRLNLTAYDFTGGTYFQSRNVQRFHFPSAQWLLMAMAIYILLVGSVNFALLRWMKRLELGWVTVPVLAILFAIFFYAYSSSHRPGSTALDEASVYWMDARSNVAFMQHRTVVSSPQRGEMVLTAPTETSVLAWTDWSTESGLSSITSVFDPARDDGEGVALRQGKTTELPLSLLRWSSKSFAFQGVQSLAGTVARDGNLLRNNTGNSFRDAIVIDGYKNKVYLLKSVAAGAEIDLGKVQPTSAQLVSSDMRVYLEDKEQDKPFDVREMAMTSTDPGVFFYGLSDGPTLGAKLSIDHYVRHSAALTIVRLD